MTRTKLITIFWMNKNVLKKEILTSLFRTFFTGLVPTSTSSNTNTSNEQSFSLHHRIRFPTTHRCSRTRRILTSPACSLQLHANASTWIGGGALAVSGIFFAANIAVLASTVPAILGRGAPYLPTFHKSLSFIFDEALPAVLLPCYQKENVVVVDLGSGDGRVVIEAARHGYCAVGYEINPFLVFFSFMNAARLGYYTTTANAYPDTFKHQQTRAGSATFHWLDIWKVTDLHVADVIFVYGLGPIMNRLSEKILREAKPNVIVVSNVFQIQSNDWKLVFTNGDKSVHVYQRAITTTTNAAAKKASLN